MKTLVVACHPNLDKSLVTKTKLEQIKNGAENVRIHNLNESCSDWNFNLAKEHSLLAEHDRIILLFPVYWFNLPPLLKRWIDLVFSVNWAYGSNYVLEGKEFGLSISLAGPAEDYIEVAKGGLGTVNELFSNMKAVAMFTKMKFYGIDAFFDASDIHAKERLESREEELLLFLTGK